MKRNLGSTMLSAFVFAIFLVITSISATADSGCSVANVKGRYALERHGFVVTLEGAPPVPVDEVSIASFNGAGLFEGTATVNVGGHVLKHLPFTGTYTVDPDCTGTVTVNIPALGESLSFDAVLLGGGKAVIATQTNSSAVARARAEKLDD